MKTDVIVVSSKGSQIETALSQVDKVIAYKGLTGKNALHLRLLAEEMMGMMRSITGETEGKFWIEDEDNVYQLHLQVVTRMDSGKRDQLLSAASTGKNESARGLMGRLRDFFERGADEDIASMSSPLLLPDMFKNSTSPALDWEWSMMRYENALSSRMMENDTAAKEDWDELMDNCDWQQKYVDPDETEVFVFTSRLNGASVTFRARGGHYCGSDRYAASMHMSSSLVCTDWRGCNNNGIFVLEGGLSLIGSTYRNCRMNIRPVSGGSAKEFEWQLHVSDNPQVGPESATISAIFVSEEEALWEYHYYINLFATELGDAGDRKEITRGSPSAVYTGLEPGHTYYYLAYYDAYKHEDGSTWWQGAGSEVRSFTTPAAE